MMTYSPLPVVATNNCHKTFARRTTEHGGGACPMLLQWWQIVVPPQRRVDHCLLYAGNASVGYFPVANYCVGVVHVKTQDDDKSPAVGESHAGDHNVASARTAHRQGVIDRKGPWQAANVQRQRSWLLHLRSETWEPQCINVRKRGPSQTRHSPTQKCPKSMNSCSPTCHS